MAAPYAIPLIFGPQRVGGNGAGKAVPNAKLSDREGVESSPPSPGTKRLIC